MVRSMFNMGLHHPSRTYMGQWESIISAAINAGVNVYKVRTEQEQQKDLLKFKEEQAQAAAAREQEALRIQTEALKAMTAQNNPTGTVQASTPGAPGTILGLDQTTFFIVAGLAAGALVLGTMLLTRK